MAIQFGKVVKRSVPAGASIVINGSNKDLWISEDDLARLGMSELKNGSTVRLDIHETHVQRLILISPPANSVQNTGSQTSSESTTVISADPQSGILLVRLASGKSTTLRPGILSQEDWQRLQIGSTVVLTHEPGGGTKLDLPALAKSAGSAMVLASAGFRGAIRPKSVGQDGRLTGTIAHISAYHIDIQSEDERRYHASTARFPGQSFGVGDRVTFDANEETGEILTLSVLERKADGREYKDLCGEGLSEVVLDTERQALIELARRFCEDNRIEWYWITPKRPAVYADRKHSLAPAVVQAILKTDGFDTFFTHQARALDALKAGRHVLVLTPTASGKTYCYNPAVFDTLQADPAATALYVFPLNALLMDQMKKLEEMSKALLEQGLNVRVERLIGGLEKEERSQIANNPPQILAVNPEKLNDLLYGNTSGRWDEFLRRLRFVVLDEVHSYRSLFGLHMAGILRRLQIACQRYQNPGFQYVLSSATVGAPEELATRLTGLAIDGFEIIRERDDGSAQQQRHWMMLTPEAVGGGSLQDAHIEQAALALVDVLTVSSERLNAIVFARSFREVRLIHDQAIKHLKDQGRIDLVPKVKKYASGLMDSNEKRDIYEGLNSGAYQAVVSTNALEAGIDIKSLDVCIMAGFPFHMMRLRQMAGRAGRKQEGAVIYIPSAVHSLDRFYRSHPERLLTQPPEAFVIDPDNPYIARKHIVAAASSMSSGVQREELMVFGSPVDGVLAEAVEKGIIQRTTLSSYTAKKNWDRKDPWAVGNLRSNEQTPYILCKAPEGQRHCLDQGCPASGEHRNGEKTNCPHYVQTLDRQYVYREAHPGAIYEALESGDFLQVVDLADEQQVVTVTSIGDTLERTFGVEDVSIQIRQEKGRRELGQGIEVAWGDVTVTRTYTGYFEYNLSPRRWCRFCQLSQDVDQVRCQECGRRTVSYMEKSVPKYRDYPEPYQNQTYTITLNTVGCWLVLPTEIEQKLKTAARCKIPGSQNGVSRFLQTPRFGSIQETKDFFNIPLDAAEVTFTYLEKHHTARLRQKPPKGKQPVFPVYYGQCLHHDLRERLPENEALAIFAKMTGYPVVTDERHVCRNCVSGTLLPAAHTLEHLLAKRYPAVALGDSQDLSSTTTILHPQTRGLTVFWFDNYAGGIGAAEKVFSQFNRLLKDGLSSLSCDCQSDHGCPLCIQQPYCDRGNDLLSKVAVRALIHHMLGQPIPIPIELEFWTDQETQKGDTRSKEAERAAERVPTPNEDQNRVIDSFELLRVQKHVNDVVLDVAEKIRGEELQDASPPVSIQLFQQACEEVRRAQRPSDWNFPPDWDDYQMLHVHPLASKKLSGKARKMILVYVHPDHHPDKKWAEETTKRINDSWDRIKGA